MTKRRDEVAGDICFHQQELTQSEAQALRALYKGEATPDQQRQILRTITNKLSRPHDMTYVPGDQDRGAFLAGRAFVGQRILYYLNIPVSKLPEDNNADSQ